MTAVGPAVPPPRSASFYESLVTNATDLIVVFDAAGVVTYVAPSSVRVLGYPPEELGPELRTDLFHPDDVPVISEAVLTGMTTPGLTGPTVGRLLHADGSYRHMEAIFTNLLHDPAVAAVVCNMRDVSDRLHIEARFRLMAENSTDLVSLHRLDGTTTFVSPSLVTGLGHRSGDVAGVPLLSWPFLTDTGDLAEAFAVALQGGTASALVPARAANGQMRWLDFALGPVVDALTDEVISIQSAARDITQEVVSRGDLSQSESRFRTLFESAPAGMLLLDDDGHVRQANAAAASMIEIPGTPLVGQEFYALLHPADADRLKRLPRMNEPEKALALEVRYRGPAGWRWAHVAVNVLRAGARDRVLLAHLHDIDSVKRAQQQLWTAAHHDALTGLPNRLVLADLLPGSFLAGTATQHETPAPPDAVGAGSDAGPEPRQDVAPFAAESRIPWPQPPRSVLLLDLVRFKRINDVLGHAAGDELLRLVAARLVSVCATGDLVVRLGGDEFIVVSADPSPLDLAHRVREAIREAVSLRGRTLHVDAAIGAATVPPPTAPDAAPDLALDASRDADSRVQLSPDDGRKLEAVDGVAEALRLADAALYESKRPSSTGVTLASADTARAAAERLSIETDLRASLRPGCFPVHYQPVFDLQTRRIVAAEALVRWEHPTRGLLHPSEFLEVAEESGLILPIGAMVLRQACVDAVGWTSEQPLSVTVNVSPRQLGHFHPEVREALAASGLHPRRLVLEITESATIATTLGAREDLEAIAASGVRVAVDDFGTGYAPLTRLKEVPASVVKIDRQFVAGVTQDGLDQAIVASVVAMAHAAGCAVVAEGVESAEQGEALARLGCEMGQGFLLSPPVVAADIPQLLTGARPRTKRLTSPPPDAAEAGTR